MLHCLSPPAHLLTAQCPCPGSQGSAPQQGVASFTIPDSEPSIRGLQHRGHIVHGSMGIRDNRGVLHVFSCGDWSLFSGLPTKQPEGNDKQGMKLSRLNLRVSSFLLSSAPVYGQK